MIIEPSEAQYPELLAVWEASVRATHDFISEADIQFYKPLILQEYFYAVQLYCAVDEQGVVQGFMGLEGDKLEMLFIAPAVRGQGIGKILLQYAIQTLGVRCVDVNEQNEQAVGFYRHMGFGVIRRSPLDGAGKPYPILSMELTTSK